jgi:hypothetical protein
MNSDNQRIQVDVRHLPEGVKPKLIEMARECGVSLTDYIRTVLCDRALLTAEWKVSRNVVIEADSDYVPYEPVV